MRLADVVAVLFSDFFWASLDGELGRIVDAVKRSATDGALTIAMGTRQLRVRVDANESTSDC